MAGIAGVSSSSSSELIAMLQQLAPKRAESSTTTSTSSQSKTAASGSCDSRFETALINAGVDSSKMDELKSAIKSAVSSAISSADGTSDAREVVGKAIEQTLTDYGVDTAAVKEEMESQMGSMRPSGPQPGGQGPGGAEGFQRKVAEALTASGASSDSLEEIQNAIEKAVASIEEDAEGGKDGEAVKSAVHEVLDQYGIDAEAFDAEMEAGMGGRPPQGAGPGGPPPQGQGGSASSTSSADSLQWLSGLFQWIDEEA